MLKYLIPVLYPRFKEEFPGWSILVQKVTEKNLTIKEVITCTGLTRRQIDYWIEKGTLSPFSRKSQKWKRFSIFDLFIFAVGYEFRVKGIDIAMLPGIRDGIPMDDPARTGIFAHIIYGDEVILYSDFKNFTNIIDIEPKETVGEFFYIKKMPLPEKPLFFTGVSLKRICDKLVRRLDLPNFKVNILPDGKYKFIIDNVPLELEPLKRGSPPKTLEQFKKMIKEGTL